MSKEKVVWKEGLIGLGAGVVFGATSVGIGHSFDTIKTKMQTQSGFENKNMLSSFKSTLRSQGIRGFYRGWQFPLIGSTFYRSAQFGAYEAIYTYLNNKYGHYKLLETYRLHALAGGLGSATVRALIETPLEYAKIRKQTGRTPQLTNVYTGFGITWSRTIVFLSSFFYIRDFAKRNYPEVFTRPIVGPFILGGVVATFAWWVVWPLENIKSQIQGSYGEKLSALQRIKLVYGERGFLGLYRGILPGTFRSFFANGIGLIVYEVVQRKLTKWSYTQIE